MAVLDVYAPFDSGAGANVLESTWREMMKHMLGSASGVIRGFDNDFAVTGDSSGMQVKAATGQCWMRGHFGRSTSIKTLPIAANATGSTRIDRVVLRADFVANTIGVEVVTGTTVAPAVTQNSSLWETSLALVSVANGAVTITAGNVTDDRVYTTVFAKYTRNTNQAPIADSTNTDIIFNNTAVRCGDVAMNGAGTQFTLNRAGIWTIVAQYGITFPASGNPYGRTIWITDGSNNSISELTVAAPSNAFNAYLQVAATEYFPAGQQIKVRCNQRSGTTLSLLADTIRVSFMWVGP